jgi:hypothetical protein
MGVSFLSLQVGLFVGTRAPALVPGVFDLAAISLGRAAVLDAVGWLKGHAVLFCQPSA